MTGLIRVKQTSLAGFCEHDNEPYFHKGRSIIDHLKAFWHLKRDCSILCDILYLIGLKYLPVTDAGHFLNAFPLLSTVPNFMADIDAENS